VDPREAIVQAARNISYGRHRIEAGYTQLDVDPGPKTSWESLDLGSGKQESVPSKIIIVGRKP